METAPAAPSTRFRDGTRIALVATAATMFCATTGSDPAMAAAETLALTPAADTYVDSSAPTTSFGSTRSFWVDGNPAKQAFMRFDVGALSGRTITGARLRLTEGDESVHGGRVFSMSSTDWSEQVTWNSRPAIDGPQLASFGAVSRGLTYEVELGPLTASNGYLALAIESADPDGHKWYSREAGHQAPQLIVEISDEAPPPPPPNPLQLSYGFEVGDSAIFDNAGTIATVSEPVNTGAAAMRAGTNSYRSFHTNTTLGMPTFYRFYARWDQALASGAAIPGWLYSDAGRVAVATIRVDTQNRVSLRDVRGVIKGQTAPLATGTWHLIEFAATQSGEGGGSASLRVNGATIGSDLSGTFNAPAADRFRVGQIGTTGLPGITIDDVAVGAPGGTWIGPAGG